MTKKRLRIVITSLPRGCIPPITYGGIERLVSVLVYGLIERGHEVHLFAHPDSKAPVKLIPYKENKKSLFCDAMLKALQIRDYVQRLGDVDFVLNFSRLAHLLFIMRLPVLKIHSYHLPITPRSVRLGILLGGKSLVFTACSNSHAGPVSFAGAQVVIVPNGVPITTYTFNPYVPSDAPLVFLGRIQQDKGPHIAIKVAKRAGRELIIAGFHDASGRQYEYFTKEVLPYIDGKAVKYIGLVNDTQKNELLGNASALLFPIQWDEPFGLVMIEALACGTPVISFRRGAIPEVIKHKETGFVCDSIDDMLDAVKNINSINRARCRQEAEERFSDKAVVERYEQLYYDHIKKMEND